MSSNYWIKKKGNQLLLAPPPDVADTALELLLESQLQQNYKYHMMVVTRLVQFLWRDQIWKGAGFLFTLPVRIPFWGLGEYETLIIAFFSLLSLAGIGRKPETSTEEIRLM